MASDSQRLMVISCLSARQTHPPDIWFISNFHIRKRPEHVLIILSWLIYYSRSYVHVVDLRCENQNCLTWSVFVWIHPWHHGTRLEWFWSRCSFCCFLQFEVQVSVISYTVPDIVLIMSLRLYCQWNHPTVVRYCFTRVFTLPSLFTGNFRSPTSLFHRPSLPATVSVVCSILVAQEIKFWQPSICLYYEI